MQNGHADPTERSIKFDYTTSKAFNTLTSDATNPADGGTITVDGRVYTLKSTLTAAVAASGTLTSDNDQVTAGARVTIGSLIYQFVEALSTIAPMDYIEVLIGSDADDTLANLKAAINETLATFGVKYSKNARANTLVSAGNITSHALALAARTAGTAGNSITLTTDEATYTPTAFASGVDTVADQIKIGASAAVTLDNIKAAINGTGTPGTEYSVGTTAHATVSCTTNTDTTQVFEVRTGGTAGNSVAITENATHLSFDSVAGGGGTVGRQLVGKGRGGKINRIISKCPQLTGTPTYTVGIQSAGGSALYTTGSLNENAVTNTAQEMVLADDDYIVITASGTVESTLPVLVSLR